MGRVSRGYPVDIDFELSEDFKDLYEALDYHTEKLSEHIGRVETVVDNPNQYGISRLEEEYKELVESTVKYSVVRNDVKHIERVVEDVEHNFPFSFDNVEDALDSYDRETTGNKEQINSTAIIAYERMKNGREPKSRQLSNLEWQAEKKMEDAESLLVKNTS